jgi:hypothetical protein
MTSKLLGPFTLAALTLAMIGAASAETTETVRPPHAYTTYPARSTFPPAPDIPAGPLEVGANRRIITKAGAQSETTIAVDPTDARHLLAASNDLSTFTSYNNVVESFDGGRTWASAGLSVNTFCYDPWLAFNANGDAFFAYECGDQRIAYREAGASNWVHTTLVPSGPFPDRDMVTVDTNPSSPGFNRVYIGYDEAAFNNAAHVLYSPDGFGSWTKSPTINDTSSTIGVNVTTCPSGSVHAFWEDFSGRKLWADRSTNGGATWGTDRLVTNYRLLTGSFFISIPPQPDRGILPMPFSDCAPEGTDFAGRVYVTYVDKSPTSADTDVYVRYSDNGGQTWSAETEVDDEAVNAYQFHPHINVGPDGTVAVSFYDTRDDFPNNEKTLRMISFSTDGGQNWSANVRLASGQSDESGPGDPNDYGDYQGQDARPDQGFWNIWTDSRPGTIAEDGVGVQARP